MFFEALGPILEPFLIRRYPPLESQDGGELTRSVVVTKILSVFVLQDFFFIEYTTPWADDARNLCLKPAEIWKEGYVSCIQ